MSTLPDTRFLRAFTARWSFGLLLLALALLGARPAWAQDDPPGRVGRLADLAGGVSWYDHESGAWSQAERNRPLTGGDRLSTGPQGRAELRVGSTVLRLAGGTELEVVRLDDERMVFELHTGSLALRVKNRESAAEIEVDTVEARFRPDRAGHYRFDRVDDSTQAGVWRGTLRIDDAEGFILETGQRAELWRERRSLRFSWTQLPADDFAAWAQREDQRDERTASNRYVSPEMTGAEDLDRDGRWERHPEYGAIWFPLEVQAGWAPYRYGRWVWVRPWGWTWVDEARWGFAPFHYGRWVNYGGRWGWCPGEYVARPVYAPALVAWVGGGNVGVSISIGGPTVGWVPLSPRDWYAPYYRHTPVYYDRVNRVPPGVPGWVRQPRPRGDGPVVWGNQAVPGAVTVVPRDVLLERKPVWRGAVDTRDWHREAGRTPLPGGAPPPRVEGPRGDGNWRQPGQADGRPPRMGPASPGTPAYPAPAVVAPQPVIVSPPVVLPPADRGDRGDRGREDRDRFPPRGDRPDRGERWERGDRGPAPQAPVRPAPAMPAPPAAVPAPMPQPAAPARPAPPAAAVQPAPAVVAPPPPPPRAPMSPPERAQQREADRAAQQQPAQPADDRKRGPEAPRGPRERNEREK